MAVIISREVHRHPLSIHAKRKKLYLERDEQKMGRKPWRTSRKHNSSGAADAAN